MGTCQCQKKNISDPELNDFFTRKKKLDIKKSQDNLINIEKTDLEPKKEENIDNDNIDNNNDNNNKKERQKLKELPNLINARIINNFISKNLNRIYHKSKYNKLKAQTKNIFFENEEINFTYNQAYFKQLFDSKLSNFLKNKDNIINDLLSENFRKSLYSLSKLKTTIIKLENNYILNRHKEYLNKIFTYAIENNLITKKISKNKIIKQVSCINMRKDELNINNVKNSNFFKTIKKKSLINKYSKRNSEDKIKKSLRSFKTKNYEIKKNLVEIKEEVKNNSFENSNNKLGKELEFNKHKEIIPISKESLIKIELEKFFEISFGDNKKYLDFEIHSIFFNILISKEENEKYFTSKLLNIINLLHYAYIMKKYDFLSDTNKSFYKINSTLIKRKSRLTNMLILNKKEYKLKKENNLKMKILKGIFKQDEKDKQEISESMSSISSDENTKENNSLISLSKELSFVKLVIKNKNNCLTNINHSQFMEEEKNEYIKTGKDASINISINIENDKEKNSSDKKIKRKKSDNKFKSPSFTEYYNGQFDNTIYLYAGIGTLVNYNFKKLYYGTFRYGKKEGIGILYTIKDEKSMEYFMGEFHNNKISGFGTKIEINDNELIYKEGTFNSDNLINGKFKKIIIKENEIITIKYIGGLENKKFSGYGEMLQKTYILDKKISTPELIQKMEYKGKFFNDKKNGDGVEILKHFKISNKNYEYHGNFLNNKKDGYGKIFYDKNNFVNKYEGFFVEDKPFQYYGKINFKSGDIYEGFFENSLKDNVGLYLFFDEKTKKHNEEYFGGFLEDYKDGIGRTVVYNLDVKMLRGKYKKGDKDGEFEKIIYKNEAFDRNKRRRNGKIKDNLYKLNVSDEKRDEKLPRIQIKSFPVYEENEIVDINDNFFYDN